MNMFEKENSLIRHKNDFFANVNTTPTRQHQISDELMKLRREFGAMIRSQKDREGRHP